MTVKYVHENIRDVGGELTKRIPYWGVVQEFTLNDVKEILIASSVQDLNGRLGSKSNYIAGLADYAIRQPVDAQKQLFELKGIAANIFARLYWPDNLASGTVMPREVFKYQARLLGYEVESIPVTYRVDSRTPVETR